MTQLQTMTPFQWLSILLAVCLCAPQGILLFLDAQKRGRFPWLWGLWGLLSFPLPTVFYCVFIVLRDKKHRQGKDGEPTVKDT